jgi:hypothetical protein
MRASFRSKSTGLTRSRSQRFPLSSNCSPTRSPSPPTLGHLRCWAPHARTSPGVKTERSVRAVPAGSLPPPFASPAASCGSVGKLGPTLRGLDQRRAFRGVDNDHFTFLASWLLVRRSLSQIGTAPSRGWLSFGQLAPASGDHRRAPCRSPHSLVVGRPPADLSCRRREQKQTPEALRMFS